MCVGIAFIVLDKVQNYKIYDRNYGFYCFCTVEFVIKSIIFRLTLAKLLLDANIYVNSDKCFCFFFFFLIDKWIITTHDIPLKILVVFIQII